MEADNVFVFRCAAVIGIILILVLCGRNHPFWSYSIKIKLWLPVLLALTILSVLCSMSYTHVELKTLPVQSEGENEGQIEGQNQFEPFSFTSRNSSELRGLINIGCVHTSTSSIQTVMCRIDKVICSKHEEFSYFPERKKSRYLSLFSENPSSELLYNSSLFTLSNWTYPIDDILTEYPFDEWLKHWNIASRNYSDFTLYGKMTSHYSHPPTALVFAHMAFHRKWSFFLHIREPIKRTWSVQQHWHTYHGTKQEIRDSAANDVWSKFDKMPKLKQLVSALKVCAHCFLSIVFSIC